VIKPENPLATPTKILLSSFDRLGNNASDAFSDSREERNSTLFDTFEDVASLLALSHISLFHVVFVHRHEREDTRDTACSVVDTSEYTK
jgi:hypothetical protein